MANKVTAPVIGAEIDPNDPSGTAMNVLLGIVGVMITLAIIVLAQTGFNRFADTSDAIPRAEVV